ncbi:MAG: hypothetical protein HOC23_09660, partial [Halieaceae bacterium]|nr:hypothetical protein [Halieaceae bacterium]
MIRSLSMAMILSLGLAMPVSGAIVIDGVLDEPEWRNAKVFAEFITTEPL